jgi:hypothetical protein
MKAKARMFRDRIYDTLSENRIIVSLSYHALDGWPVPNGSYSQASFGEPTGRCRMAANSPEAISLRTVVTSQLVLR